MTWCSDEARNSIHIFRKEDADAIDVGECLSDEKQEYERMVIKMSSAIWTLSNAATCVRKEGF
jgi:hypothetical protein